MDHLTRLKACFSLELVTSPSYRNDIRFLESAPLYIFTSSLDTSVKDQNLLFTRHRSQLRRLPATTVAHFCIDVSFGHQQGGLRRKNPSHHQARTLRDLNSYDYEFVISILLAVSPFRPRPNPRCGKANTRQWSPCHRTHFTRRSARF